MNVLGSISVADGWRQLPNGQRERVPFVSLTIYGDGGDEPSPERLGVGMAAVFKAAEAALELDPYGKPKWTVRLDFYLYQGVRRWYVYHNLAFEASSGDVIEGGPIHRERAHACRRAMARSLDQSVGSR